MIRHAYSATQAPTNMLANAVARPVRRGVDSAMAWTLRAAFGVWEVVPLPVVLVPVGLAVPLESR